MHFRRMEESSLTDVSELGPRHKDEDDRELGMPNMQRIQSEKIAP
ncbi:MAG TPA: hypothetical protein VL202_09365 [Pararhizobium sp.]|nr:hypothetical protein [Pararhizobium sp.]HTO31372.1 hypothetical protein [Pararhizobium sp.]